MNRFYVMRENKSHLAADVYDAVSNFTPGFYAIGGTSKTLINLEKEITIFYPWGFGTTPYNAIYSMCGKDTYFDESEVIIEKLNDMDFISWILIPVTSEFFEELSCSKNIHNIRGFISNEFIGDKIINI